jgi:hypothetical protein
MSKAKGFDIGTGRWLSQPSMETTGYFFNGVNSATAGANNNVMRMKLIRFAIMGLLGVEWVILGGKTA